MNYKKGDIINNTKNYYVKNVVGVVGMALCAVIIAYYSGNQYINAIFTMLISSLVTWFGHYLLHNHNTYYPIAWLHKITHHSPFSETLLGKFIEYAFVEFFFFGAGILLIIVIMIHRSYHVYILNPYVIFAWAIAVPFIHEIHYHILELSLFHKTHHSDTGTHYSPDYWDVIFDKRQDNTPIENETLMLPELIFVTILVVIMINSKYDFIKYVSE
jgi:hypothetical protein